MSDAINMLETVKLALLEGKVPETLTSVAVAANIAQRILDADTAEEILAQAKPEHAEDHFGQSFELASVDWQLSSYENGSPVYAVMRGRWVPEGTPVTLIDGGTNVVAACVRLVEKDLLPIVVQVIQADRQTAQGYWPHWLIKGYGEIVQATLAEAETA